MLIKDVFTLWKRTRRAYLSLSSWLITGRTTLVGNYNETVIKWRNAMICGNYEALSFADRRRSVIYRSRSKLRLIHHLENVTRPNFFIRRQTSQPVITGRWAQLIYGNETSSRKGKGTRGWRGKGEEDRGETFKQHQLYLPNRPISGCL